MNHLFRACFDKDLLFFDNSNLSFTIYDAPFDNEIVIAIGGASSGRAHARTGDRYQDMKEMGIEPK